MLLRKMRRDLWEQKGAYTACCVVIAVGLMVFSSLSMVMDNLLLSRDSFYQNQHFADGFAELTGMPYAEVSRLAGIEGLDMVQGRLVKDVRVVMPGKKDQIYLRLVSVDSSQPLVINDVLLLEGAPLPAEGMNLWLDNKFFAAQGLSVGDEISLIAEGRLKTFQVLGNGQSPEFIYALRTAADLFPDPETFGIGYVPLSVMKNLFQEKSLVNNLVFTLKPGYTFDQVKPLLESELKPYGLKSLYPREDQVSHVLLTQELAGLQAMAKAFPLIFLSVAAMILYIMLKRMIEQQRTQLGTLKAFGYTNREILFHYLSYALLTGLAGGLLGALSGSALTGPFLAMYREFFNMPGMQPKFEISYFFLSLLLAALFSLLAGYQGSRKLLALEPAEAMRPAAPPAGKSVLLEKALFFWKMLTVQGKMALRNMMRNKVRTAFLFLGIMFTYTLLAMPWSFKVLSDQMLFAQFEKTEVYDVKLPLAALAPAGQAENELARFPGVQAVESMAEIPVTLHHSWREKNVTLLGIKADSALYHLRDSQDKPISLPTGGILISQRLADLLEAEAGTLLTVESLLFKDPEQRKQLPVVGIIPQNLGMNAYMELSALQDFLGQGELATSLMVRMDEKHIPLLEEKYKDSKMIASIENRLSQLQDLKDLMASYMGMIYSLFIFGIIIGFAIIYNTSVITLSERSRELASMMVLGMTPQEVLEVITFEQWFVSFFAMLAGIPLTKAFMAGIADSMGNDVFGFTPTLNTEALLLAFLITVLSILFAQRMAARKLNRLSLVEVLKSRE